MKVDGIMVDAGSVTQIWVDNKAVSYTNLHIIRGRDGSLYIRAHPELIDGKWHAIEILVPSEALRT